MGWRVRVRLHDGQIPDDYVKVAERLAHAWRVYAVRVVDSAPGSVTLLATMRDPLTTVDVTPETGDLLTVRPGRLENGRDWVIDFRTVPHWLNAGATQSGKSNLANAIIKGLAPQPIAIVGLDLKGGVEFTPYKPRLSALGTTRGECVGLLDDLVGVLTDRMRICREAGARNVWKLPDQTRPVPIVVLVDPSKVIALHEWPEISGIGHACSPPRSCAVSARCRRPVALQPDGSGCQRILCHPACADAIPATTGRTSSDAECQCSPR
jgi:hypothetical protein